MSLELITPPAVEPLSLQEAAAHLRVLDSSEDVLTLQAVRSARQYVERVTRRALITQEWRLSLPCFSPTIELPLAPIQSVESIMYIDQDGNEQGFIDYDEDLAGEPALLWSDSWPIAAIRPDAVRIEFTAGYGDSPDDTPEMIRSAMKLAVADMMEDRQNAIAKPWNATNAILERFVWRRKYA